MKTEELMFDMKKRKLGIDEGRPDGGREALTG
jgi:hypothetical protein